MFELLVLGTIVVAIAKGLSRGGTSTSCNARTIDESDFQFYYEQIYSLRRPQGEWRAYIAACPDYGNRDSSLSATHRLRDTSTGRMYVCWTEPLRSLDECRTVSWIWAQNTKAYIESGTRF